uniref:Ion-translocating oxidoreductase complex subunit B n=1 Tax=candidate division WOR-3 bacterium TaxID=2052148 RepID=A0A7C4U6V3_UNCW3
MITSVLTLGIICVVFGLFLTYVGKKFHVEVDPKLLMIREALPNANCGGCGFPGCDKFAEEVFKGNAPLTGCVVGGASVAERIGKILGKEVGTTVQKIAVVQCLGSKDVAKRIAEYTGDINTCSALDTIGGDKGCVYGCLGLGDCVKVCIFDAIEMGDNGLPVIDEEKCTACGACVKACPRKIITLIPKNQKVYLGCVSPERGTDVSKVCSKGCIGCSLCSRVVPEGMIVMDGFIPRIQYEKVDDYEKLKPAVEKCPTKTYIVRG